ncbi:DUF3889 domain-containing protein [Oceanobacillus senegalensis]|uniref:DUF3889 domain-containing protein n=1 Tax=Oceanobacillus senegalensis TaxID=1936063 RepID=UPI000A30FF2A|nr:DUF3889 domain-containing protein [Oceanobacillus senegalensis]
MYPYYSYYPYTPYIHPNFLSYYGLRNQNHYFHRQQPVTGQVTWTEGGELTKCEIPWSFNEYMTAAVGEDSPYGCGDSIKIKNISAPYGREVIVTVVDEVAGYPPNRINIHRRAFEALGVNPNIGVLNVEITPTPELEQERWGKYLLEVTQVAYPSYRVTEYRTVGKSRISESQIKETYEFVLQSAQEKIKVQGNVVYNPNTDRVYSFDIKEV